MANEECIFCFEFKTDPVGIPCGHTFCKVCLENYERVGRGTKCPLCRYPFAINDDEESESESLNLTEDESDSDDNQLYSSGYLAEGSESESLNLTEDEIDSDVNFQYISEYLEEEIEAEPMLFDESEQEASSLNDAFQVSLNVFQQHQENEEANSLTSPEEYLSSLSEEEEQDYFVLNMNAEEEYVNFSLHVNQVEFDETDEFPMELDDEEPATDLSDDENDEESYEML